MIEFIIPGAPVAKGRPRFSTRGGFVRAHTPKATADHEQIVRKYAAAAFNGPLTGALRLEVVTFHAIPISLRKAEKEAALLGSIRPAKKPDADNLAKQIADSLVGIAYQDDAQVVEIEARKFYGIEPRTIVKVVRV